MNKTMFGTAMGVCVSLAHLVGCGSMPPANSPAAVVIDGYNYGGAGAPAVAAYQSGWAYILDDGRWTASEAAFREAVRLDTDWVMSKAQVARITRDLGEREALLAEIEAGYAAAPEDSRLLLDVYLMNIRATNARDRGERMPEGFAAKRMATAVTNFTRFGERHPGETYIQAERVEWVHAAEGAAAGLTLMKSLPATVLAAPFFAGYEATLHAELGNMPAAWKAFARFEASMEAEAPAVPYLRAQLLHAEGEFAEALSEAKRATELDPKHQLAVRLVGQLQERLAR